MKTLLPVLALALSAAGCASVRNPPPASTEIDEAYVASVEDTARRLGTKIIWLSYPTRPVDAAAAEPAKK